MRTDCLTIVNKIKVKINQEKSVKYYVQYVCMISTVLE